MQKKTTIKEPIHLMNATTLNPEKDSHISKIGRTNVLSRNILKVELETVNKTSCSFMEHLTTKRMESAENLYSQNY